MRAGAEPQTINRENAQRYSWGNGCDGWRRLAGADLSVTEERIPPGRGEARHLHRRARQVFFVVAGRLEIVVGSRVERLVAGDSLEIRPEQSHEVRNRSSADAWFLVISAPSTQDDRVDLAGSSRPGR